MLASILNGPLLPIFLVKTSTHRMGLYCNIKLSKPELRRDYALSRNVGHIGPAELVIAR